MIEDNYDREMVAV